MIEIRRLAKTDAKELRALGITHSTMDRVSGNPGFWGMQDLEFILGGPRNGVGFGAFDGRLVGFSLASIHHGTGDGNWHNLFLEDGLPGDLKVDLARHLLLALRDAGIPRTVLTTDRKNLVEQALVIGRNFNGLGHLKWDPHYTSQKARAWVFEFHPRT